GSSSPASTVWESATTPRSSRGLGTTCGDRRISPSDPRRPTSGMIGCATIAASPRWFLTPSYRDLGVRILAAKPSEVLEPEVQYHLGMASRIDDAVTFTGRASPGVSLDPATALDDPTVMRGGFAWLPGGASSAEQRRQLAPTRLVTKTFWLATIGALVLLA